MRGLISHLDHRLTDDLIAAEQEDVIVAVSNQNFVPIVDGRGVFCGIITRKGVIESLAKELEK